MVPKMPRRVGAEGHSKKVKQPNPFLLPYLQKRGRGKKRKKKRERKEKLIKKRGKA